MMNPPAFKLFVLCNASLSELAQNYPRATSDPTFRGFTNRFLTENNSQDTTIEYIKQLIYEWMGIPTNEQILKRGNKVLPSGGVFLTEAYTPEELDRHGNANHQIMVGSDRLMNAQRLSSSSSSGASNRQVKRKKKDNKNLLKQALVKRLEQ